MLDNHPKTIKIRSLFYEFRI